MINPLLLSGRAIEKRLMTDPDEIVRKELEKLGEEAVRLKHAQRAWGTPGSRGHAVVSQWLRQREEARAESRDSETRALARHANTIAVIAAIIAVASLIVTIIIAVVK